MKENATNFVKSVHIENFKSLKSVTLSDCRRINVLIGRPNVGKSNLLEALALFDVPFLVNASNKSLNQLVRIENVAELFYNGLSCSPIKILADNNSLLINHDNNYGLTVEIGYRNEISKYNFSSSLNLSTKKEPQVMPDIRAYYFPKPFIAKPSNASFLLPPSGSNLMGIVANLPQLKASFAEIFHENGFNMVLDPVTHQIKGLRENGLDMFLIPYNSLGDSLQRLIFYRAAIESNHNKVLCFEEPEAHTFPPYVSMVINSVIDNTDNQFFITTNSTYVMTSLLEYTDIDLTVYVLDMKDGETVVHRLSDLQLQQAYDNGMDMFFNIEAFINE